MSVAMPPTPEPVIITDGGEEMAQVKWNMSNAIAITNIETGETIFLPCEGIEVPDALFKEIQENPETIDSILIKFKKDEVTGGVRAYLQLHIPS